MNITVIVPRLPPSIDGLGDYGLILAKELKEKFKIDSAFIVCDPKWDGPLNVDGFLVTKIKSRTKPELLSLLPGYREEIVLLHYVGYGYAKKGAPLWLIRTLEEWIGASSGRKLVMMMHEIYAFGPIWTSQFWTSWLQRDIAARLVRLSDHCVTSKTEYAKIMERYSKGKHHEIKSVPVFSNIGEPKHPRDLTSRKSRLVIFGSRVPRQRVYRHSVLDLEKICKQLSIEEIWDIGATLGFELPLVNGKKIKEMGVLQTSEISEILSDSQVGFFNYPTEYLTKSGIFAAYCSHGVLPVGTYWSDQQVDGVIAGEHFVIVGQDSEINMIKAQEIATKAYDWYQGHSINKQALIFKSLLE